MEDLPKWFLLLYYLSDGDATKYPALKKIPLSILRAYYYTKRIEYLNEIKSIKRPI